MKEVRQNRDICKEAVFSGFFNDHVKMLRNYLLYKFGNEEQANDISQEAFMKLWQNCSKIPIDKARSFIYTVANNAALNQLSHNRVVVKFAKSEKPDKLNHETPEFILEEEQFRIKLQNAIQNLTEAQRVAFLLNRIDGKKYAEIAEILNIGIKAVEKRIHGALVALRKEIENLK